MTRNLTLIAGLLMCAAFPGCQNSTHSDAPPAFASYQSPYPKGSGVAISRSLEEDAIRSLQKYLHQQYGSDAFEILARETLGAAKAFFIDEKGRLVSGELHEVWTLKLSGKVTKLEFIMFSDGKRGNTVGFKEYRE